MGQFETYEELAKSNKSTTEIVGRYKEQEKAEKFIFPDLLNKLNNLSKESVSICDIGCGCGSLVDNLIAHAEKKSSSLLLIDSQSMLDRITEKPFINKVSGKFPSNISNVDKKFDVIIVYSVLQCVFLDGNVFNFLDNCVDLLEKGGELLIGDIPNASKKKRFLKTEFGLNLHKKTSTVPVDRLIKDDFNKMALDDSFLLMILSRYRNMGFETYILSQDKDLPFSFTREDILIRKNT